MNNYFGHWLSDQATSDPTWPILRGEIMTILEGRRSESAQSNLTVYMGQAQHFSLFIYFYSYQFSSITWAKPNISASLIFRLWAYYSQLIF